MSGFGRKHDYRTDEANHARSQIYEAVTLVSKIPRLLESLEPPFSRPSKEAVLKDMEAWEGYANDLRKFIDFVKREQEEKRNPNPLNWQPREIRPFNTIHPAPVVCDNEACPCRKDPTAMLNGRRLWLGVYYTQPATCSFLCSVCYGDKLLSE